MEALYTKYRPKTWDQVVGQPVVVKSFKSCLAKGTNRAFLLTGPSGTGKTTLARIAADTLGYQVQEIDAATFTGIDDMRQIAQQLLYRPLDGTGGKLIIIDECHALSKAAWQSLLKAIEEPPAWVVWVFCTTDPAKVLDTIKTRCIKYDLKPVPMGDLRDLLDSVADQENVLGGDLGTTIIELCAKHAQGSPRAALVNMGACLTAKTKAEALELLKSAEESVAAVDLARALMARKPWPMIVEILKGLENENPESVRHVVRGYMTKVIMGSGGKGQEANFAVLDAFSKPFPSTDGISPLVLACGSLLFGSAD